MNRKKALKIACLSSLVAGSTLLFIWVNASIPSPTHATHTTPKSTLSYQIKTYRSRIFQHDRTYGIVLPPRYQQQSSVRYPVIFLLHGGHGDSKTWFTAGNAVDTIEQLYASGKLPPSIVITPDGNDDRGSNLYSDPQYVNGQHGNVLGAIGDELVQEIKTHYRTETDPRFWAIGGMSSGGWGALNVGLHYPNQFKTLFSHSGYFSDQSGAENSPIDYIRTLDPKIRRSLSVYLDAGEGSGDRRFLGQAQAFHQVLNQVEVENKFNQFPGGHQAKPKDLSKNFWHQQYHQMLAALGDPNETDIGWKFWRKHLADSLSYVGERFRAVDRASR